jgi:uncharacterized protein
LLDCTPMSTFPHSKIAIIGSSLSGLLAAYALSRYHDVHIFESESQMGGKRALTQPPSDNTPYDVFPLIFNPKSHPLFRETLSPLGITTKNTYIHQGYNNHESKLSYSDQIPFGIAAQPRNLVSKPYLKLLREIIYFHYRAKKDLKERRLSQQSTAEYLSKVRYSDLFIDTYFLPLAGYLLATTATEVQALPAQLVLSILHKNGFLGDKPCYSRVETGYSGYVSKIISRWQATPHTQTTVSKIHRYNNRIEVETATGKETFDYVIFATTADTTLGLIENPSHKETKLLSAVHYTTGTEIVHTDTSLLGDTKKAWGTQHHTQDSKENRQYVTSYRLNKRYKFRKKATYIYSFYPKSIPIEKPSETHILQSTEKRYPQISGALETIQKELPLLNDNNRSFFCGNYFGLSPIEGSVASVIQVLHHFNCKI